MYRNAHCKFSVPVLPFRSNQRQLENKQYCLADRVEKRHKPTPFPDIFVLNGSSPSTMGISYRLTVSAIIPFATKKAFCNRQHFKHGPVQMYENCVVLFALIIFKKKHKSFG